MIEARRRDATGLFADGPFDFAGEHYTITGLRRPAQAAPRPAVRRCSSAVAAPRMLRWAGADADIVGVNPSIHSGEIDAGSRPGRHWPSASTSKVEWVREGRR